MSAEHIVWRHEQMLKRCAKGFAIDSDVAECDPFEDEVAVFKAFPHVAGDSGTVFPDAFSNPLHRVFVGAVEGVGDEALGHEVGMDAAGHSGGIPLTFILEFPIGEIEDIHFTVAAYKEQQSQQEGNNTFHKNGIELSVGF